MKLIKKIGEGISALSGMIGVLSIDGILEQGCSVIPTIIIFSVCGICAYSIWKINRYEEWKIAETNRKNRIHRKHFDASRLAGLQG